MTERPVIRALIARKLSNGNIGRSRVVPLYVAYMAMKAGTFHVVGPDPEDMDRLAQWERENEPGPFNPLRLE